MKRNILLLAVALGVAGCSSTQPQRTEQGYNTQPNYHEHQTEFVGPRGAQGPTGQVGARGPGGEQGSSGHGVAGPRGQEGPSGSMGEAGPTGATGASGALAGGPVGGAGPSGVTGEQGGAGLAGTRGASAAGPAGPTGPAGLKGPQGPAGQTGAQGSTLVGPAGPIGPAGAHGAQGAAGQTGPQGGTTAGIAGAAGPSGAAGARGPAGPTGDRGPVGVLERWTSYRDFEFEYDKADIQPSQTSKVSEIAAYMMQSPSLQVGIDGTMDPRGADPRNQDLSDRRVNAVRDALRQAGVPADKISIGAFGDPQLRRDRRVEVLIKTGSANVTD